MSKAKLVSEQSFSFVNLRALSGLLLLLFRPSSSAQNKPESCNRTQPVRSGHVGQECVATLLAWACAWDAPAPARMTTTAAALPVLCSRTPASGGKLSRHTASDRRTHSPNRSFARAALPHSR